MAFTMTLRRSLAAHVLQRVVLSFVDLGSVSRTSEGASDGTAHDLLPRRQCSLYVSTVCRSCSRYVSDLGAIPIALPCG